MREKGINREWLAIPQDKNSFLGIINLKAFLSENKNWKEILQ